MSGAFGGLGLIIAVATLLAFIARRTSQPTVIAYVLTGLLLGSVGLNIVQQTQTTKLLSELGLVFLLFLIGLEMDLKEIKKILKPTVIISVLQMGFTFVLGLAVATSLHFTMVESVIIGLAGMFSSTALVVKLLTDKDEITSLPGRLNVGVLLIQDVAVVLILALLSTNMGSISQIGLRFAEVVGLVGVITIFSLGSSRYILPKAFEKISENQHSFFIHGLAWAFLFISVAQYLNLSLEIGAFFAGLSLAQLPYSSELQERVRPLTDLFMAVFFINFALNISPGDLSAYMFEAVAASFILMLGKFVIFFGLTDFRKFTPETSFISSINMMQISEFGLILGALAVSKGIVGDEILGFLSMVAIITMSLSSYLLKYNQEIHSKLEHLFKRYESEEKQDIEVEKLDNHAVVVGYRAITKEALSALEQNYDEIVVVDKNPENIDELSESSYEFIYGDLKHSEIRRAASIDKADMILSIVSNVKVNKEIMESLDHEPTTFLKANDIREAGELYEMGAHYVIIENILTGERMREYIKTYLNDREDFETEINSDINRIRGENEDE